MDEVQVKNMYVNVHLCVCVYSVFLGLIQTEFGSIC